MRALLIDPKEQTITEVEYDGNYRSIYKLIEANTFDVVRMDAAEPAYNVVFVDDEGLLKDPEHFFLIEGFPHPLAGKGLVLAIDQEGDTVATSLAIDALTPRISYRRLKVKGFVQGERQGEIMPGLPGTIIERQTVFSDRDED